MSAAESIHFFSAVFLFPLICSQIKSLDFAYAAIRGSTALADAVSRNPLGMTARRRRPLARSLDNQLTPSPFFSACSLSFNLQWAAAAPYVMRFARGASSLISQGIGRFSTSATLPGPGGRKRNCEVSDLPPVFNSSQSESSHVSLLPFASTER